MSVCMVYGERTTVASQRSEVEVIRLILAGVRDYRPEIKDQKLLVRGRRPEVRGQRSHTAASQDRQNSDHSDQCIVSGTARKIGYLFSEKFYLF